MYLKLSDRLPVVPTCELSEEEKTAHSNEKIAFLICALI